MEIGGGGLEVAPVQRSGESVSGLRNPQSHTERCMNEKELAIQFTGILKLFFAPRFFPPPPFLPIASSAISTGS